MVERPILEVVELRAGYGAAEILHGVGLAVHPGEIVGVIGPNGSGKSTFLRSVFGLTPWARGQIVFDGSDIAGWDCSEIVAAGVGYVPQLANVFQGMTVAENLTLGGYLLPKHERTERLQAMYELFPSLCARRGQLAGTMSGGERQTLAIASALMTSPKLVLLDEPSAGLSPAATAEMYSYVSALREKSGTSLLIVEQDVKGVLSLSDRAYVLAMGRNEFDGLSRDVMKDPRIRSAYLGGMGTL